MKKTLSILLICLIFTASSVVAENTFAQNDYVTIDELAIQAKEGWHETLSAHGRDIAANVNIEWMPETDKCPIVEIREQEVNPALLDKYEGKGNDIWATSKKLANNNEVSANYSVVVDMDKKSWHTKDFKGWSSGVKYDNDRIEFKHWETPTGTPEGLDVTYEQLKNKINSLIEPLSSTTLDDYWIELVTKDGIIWTAKMKNDELIRLKPIVKNGSWNVHGSRMFDGIPLLNSFNGPSGYINVNYYNENCYNFGVGVIEKLGNVEEDVPLLSFNAIKNVLKKQIDAGQLRVIDEMQFGYLPFLKNNDNMETYILHPVWRILGSYTYDVNKENVLPYYEEDGSKSCPQEYYNYFYSAQTGEMIQAANLTHNSLPLQSIDYIAWGDIKAND